MTTATSQRTIDPGSRPAGAAQRWQLWVGRLLSAAPFLALVSSGVMKVAHAPQLADTWSKLGFPESALTPIGVVELATALLYVVPRTRFLGAALVTAYLGGAVAAHVRIGEPVVAPVVLGVLAWLGLYLRDDRARALSPLASR